MAKNFSTGELVTSRPEAPHRLPTAPPFILCHDPDAWRPETVADAEVDEDGAIVKRAEYAWLPQLKQLPISPGVNGVRMGRKIGGVVQPPDPTAAIVRLQRQGFTVIDDDFDGGWQVRHRVEGGWRYALKFERLQRYGKVTEIDFDKSGYQAFRMKLVADGVIQPIRPGRVRELKRRAHSVRTAAEESISTGPGKEARLARTMKTLEAVEQARVPA